MPNKYTVPVAARILGISEGAVRQRVARDTLPHEKDDDGRVHVLLDEPPNEETTEQTEQGAGGSIRVVDVLERENALLRRLLDEEREANRENRRLLALALEQRGELRASLRGDEGESRVQGQEEDSSASEPLSSEEERERRSWWRRVFLGE